MLATAPPSEGQIHQLQFTLSAYVPFAALVSSEPVAS